MQKVRHYESAPRVTGVKLLDVLLHYISTARTLVIAESGNPEVSPRMVLQRAYVLIEQSNIPHATKYRYKAFIRELAKNLGLGNIRIRKNKLAKTLSKIRKSKIKEYKQALPREIVRKYHEPQYKVQKIYDVEEYKEGSGDEGLARFEEADYWTPNEPPEGNYGGYGGYEDLTSYFDWEE